MYEQVKKNHGQQKMLALLLIGVVLGTWIIHGLNGLIYQRFLGQLPPVITFLVILIPGYLTLAFFLTENGFLINRQSGLKKVFSNFLLLAIFVAVSILVDIIFVFPKETNIGLPEALLFYPTIGCFVEILFHILPLGILLFLLAFWSKNHLTKSHIWLCILIVATLEPSYQVAMDEYPLWVAGVIWINLFLFNVNQLVIFKNHGFVAMYLFRLLYYLAWHIIWGIIRLEYLF